MCLSWFCISKGHVNGWLFSFLFQGPYTIGASENKKLKSMHLLPNNNLKKSYEFMSIFMNEEIKVCIYLKSGIPAEVLIPAPV